MTARALPERYRLARNLDEGYEILRDCETHGVEEWMRIASALHLLAPVKMSTFNVEPINGPLDCLDDPRLTVGPKVELFSRRPAATS